MLGFRSRASTEEVYTKFVQRLADVEARLSRVELENKDLRDKVLRKIQKQETRTFAIPRPPTPTYTTQ